ncbi:hypothetical protein DL771_007961 [Monosporascus sp. 5C6A]|nr:hypothetical protein DL771_007961 [Monosporascus sp. 5C6A]
MQEASASTRRLCALVETVLNTNQELADRIRGLEREGSVIAETTAGQDTISTVRRGRALQTVSFIETGISALMYTFDRDLQASPLYTTALSVFSKLSLSQVSNLSFYALPIYSVDLANGNYYVFGEEGVLQNTEKRQQVGESTKTSTDSQRRVSKSFSHPAPVTPTQPQTSTGLLGRFARRRKAQGIRAPRNPVHVTHVQFYPVENVYTSISIALAETGKEDAALIRTEVLDIRHNADQVMEVAGREFAGIRAAASSDGATAPAVPVRL